MRVLRAAALPLLFTLGCSAGSGLRTPAAGPAPTDAAYAALLHRAIELGRRTAYNEGKDELLCVALRRGAHSRKSWKDRLVDPDPAVVQRLQETFSAVRPYSACEIEPLRADNSSLVVEPATGKRGLLLWVAQMEDSPGEAREIQVGYYQHGLSSADWRCSLRRNGAQWAVEDCTRERIS